MARGAIKSTSNNSPSNSSSESNDDVIKIQKLLKSQWEERLKLFQQQNNQSKQSFSGQKSSKNILRKARLQLNRKTLLKIRKPESFHHLFSQNNENTKNEHKQSQLKSNSIHSYINSFFYCRTQVCVQRSARLHHVFNLQHNKVLFARATQIWTVQL